MLASQLHKFNFSLPGSPSDLSTDGSLPIPVLELGAGTGLVGLSAACLWRTGVVLTDLGPIVRGLEENIRLNRGVVHASGGGLECGLLDWGTPGALTLAKTEEEQSGVLSQVSSTRKARVILAADTIYDPSHPGMLCSAIFTWLERSPDARVCVCYPLRVAYLEEIRELWGRLEGGGLVCGEGEEGREVYGGESPNGDDERLCEWSVWRWGKRLGVHGRDGGVKISMRDFE